MSHLNRRKFISTATATSAAFILPKLLYSSFNIDEYVQAETSHGRIRGIRNNGVNIFKGVPYAGRVSGDRRFRRPAELEPWGGVRDALLLGAPAIQPPNQTYGQNEPDPDENCLYLNVWTPANDNGKRPVVFYNHGGGYATGSGGSVAQDGSNLARMFDVVVVETNHRLGIMGFLFLDDIAGPDYAGSGNMGLLDIAAGLKWVKNNIGRFGGDPDNVMICGESGGGGKTSCLYAMPEADPYFSKASIESGPGVKMLPRQAANEMTAIVLNELNIAPANWRKLLEIPVQDLLAVQLKMPQLAANSQYAKTKSNTGFVPGPFSPVVDGTTLSRHPFSPDAPEISRIKPLLVGWNEDEFTFFAMASKDTAMLQGNFEDLHKKLEPQIGAATTKLIGTYRKSRPNASAADLWIAIRTMDFFGYGTTVIAERKCKQNTAPVYLYNFGYKSEVKIPGTEYELGTPHAMDISFKFRNEVPGKGPSYFGGNRPERFIASQNLAELWTSFARSGKPTAKNVPEWPAYNLTDRPTMRIDVKCEVVRNRYAEEISAWRSIQKL